MFRAVDLDAEGQLVVHRGTDALAPPPPGTTRWLDLDGQEGDLERLRTTFGFHPLAIEDCRQFDQRPKLEEYRDHLFLVTQGFSMLPAPATPAAAGSRRAAAGPPGKKPPGEKPPDPSDAGSVSNGDMELHELHAFLGKSYLVTVHADDVPAVDDVWRRVEGSAAALERGVDFVYYLIASRLVDQNFPILDRIADELEDLEDRVLGRPRREDLARIFELKRRLVTMRKVLSPQRDTMTMLGGRGDPRVSERTAHYFRDVHDHLVRLYETIEANRDLLGNALDAYLSSVSNRTNQIMKYLAVLSAVFLPLSFIVGFFGQNFAHLPGLPDWTHSNALMYGMLAACAVTPIAMMTWFRARHWL